MRSSHELIAHLNHNSHYLRRLAEQLRDSGLSDLSKRISNLAAFDALLVLEIQERDKSMGDVQKTVSALTNQLKADQAVKADLEAQLAAAKSAPTLDAADQAALLDAQTLLATLGSDTSGGAPTGGAPTGGTPTGGAFTFRPLSTPVGTILATPDNRATYVFDGASPDIAVWPPVTVPQGSTPQGQAGLSVGPNQQATFNGRPLFTFAQDAPGQVTGDGQAGGQWHAVKVA